LQRLPGPGHSLICLCLCHVEPNKRRGFVRYRTTPRGLFFLFMFPNTMFNNGWRCCQAAQPIYWR
jgi:hypothetical protein